MRRRDQDKEPRPRRAPSDLTRRSCNYKSTPARGKQSTRAELQTRSRPEAFTRPSPSLPAEGRLKSEIRNPKLVQALRGQGRVRIITDRRHHPTVARLHGAGRLVEIQRQAKTLGHFREAKDDVRLERK